MFQLIQQKKALEAMQTRDRVEGGTCTSQMIHLSWGGAFRGAPTALDPAIEIGECRISVARGYRWSR